MPVSPDHVGKSCVKLIVGWYHVEALARLLDRCLERDLPLEHVRQCWGPYLGKECAAIGLEVTIDYQNARAEPHQGMGQVHHEGAFSYTALEVEHTDTACHRLPLC